MFFQGRGNVYLAKRDLVTGIHAAFRAKLCTDTLSVDFAVTKTEHQNKCGPVTVTDYSAIKDQTATLNFTLADAADNIFAIATLGTVTPGASGTVSGEELPQAILAGDFYFLGGQTPHRAITSLVIAGLVLNTDYTLDAARGLLTFLTDQAGSPPLTADYSYTDPDKVSLFTSSNDEWFVMYDHINIANDNKKGAFALYRVKFDPIKGLDLQSDDVQELTFTGSALADLTRDLNDAEFGRFGYRVA